MVDVNMSNKGGKNMLCDKCGINQATIQYVQVINGDKTELHLCKDCASKMGINAPNVDIPFSMPLNFSNIFNNLFDSGNRPIAEINKDDLTCPRCNTTFNDYLKKLICKIMKEKLKLNYKYGMNLISILTSLYQI